MNILRRSSDEGTCYKLTFEQDPLTNFYEQVVARNALMLNEHDRQHFGFSQEVAEQWGSIGHYLGSRQNGTSDFRTNEINFKLESLRQFGGLLYYFYDTTPHHLHRLANVNTLDSSQFSIRRTEARLALEMAEVVASRIKVVRHALPQDKPVGFLADFSKTR